MLKKREGKLEFKFLCCCQLDKNKRTKPLMTKREREKKNSHHLYLHLIHSINSSFNMRMRLSAVFFC